MWNRKKEKSQTSRDNNWTTNNEVDLSMGRISSAELGVMLLAVILRVHFMMRQKGWCDNVSEALGIIFFASPVNLLE